MSGATWFRVGAILGGLGVIAGAFGAHGLQGQLEPKMLEDYKTAVLYQMFHVPALLAVGLMAMAGRSGKALSVAGWSFLVGTLLFSGGLYVYSLTGIKMVGATVPPIGGLTLIVGWFALAAAAGRGKAVVPA